VCVCVCARARARACIYIYIYIYIYIFTRGDYKLSQQLHKFIGKSVIAK
jgi:hypothetical protein